MGFDADVRRQGSEGAAQPLHLGCRAAGRQFDVDQRRDGQVAARGILAEPRADLVSEGRRIDWMDSANVSGFAQQPGCRAAQRLAPVGIGLDNLDRGTSSKVGADRLHRRRKAKAGGCGKNGQEHHDRDHPGHGSGDAAFGQQPVAGGSGGAAICARHNAAAPCGRGG